MRLLPIFIAVILVTGCISLGERTIDQTGGDANQTAPPPLTDTNLSNQTAPPPPPPSEWKRYTAMGFSFEHPEKMEVDRSTGNYGGIFSGTYAADGQTLEMLIVSYIDTKSAYGVNTDDIYKVNPTKAATDFLEQDMRDDPAGGILSSAYDVGDISTFTVARDGMAAESEFKLRFLGSDKTFYGYAIDIYVPERSLHIKTRVLALDYDRATALKDNFLLSLRLE
ncbi:MAG: hypothetical protein V1827_03755 [Candidatus Micrarchaeota archaeon]